VASAEQTKRTSPAATCNAIAAFLVASRRGGEPVSASREAARSAGDGR
jgi:hypothetical protein